jgi:CRISPR/Cas system endoribonuclease Cas6 (RAMP superfamily)
MMAFIFFFVVVIQHRKNINFLEKFKHGNFIFCSCNGHTFTNLFYIRLHEDEKTLFHVSRRTHLLNFTIAADYNVYGKDEKMEISSTALYGNNLFT